MRIEELTPDYLASLLEGQAEIRALESAKVWRVQYGSVAEQTDHTLAYFGLIYTNAVAAEGFLWAVVLEEAEALTTADLRRGLSVWEEFRKELGSWTLIAYCDRDARRNARFIRWLGFRQAHNDQQFQYYVRMPNGN